MTVSLNITRYKASVAFGLPASLSKAFEATSLGTSQSWAPDTETQLVMMMQREMTIKICGFMTVLVVVTPFSYTHNTIPGFSSAMQSAMFCVVRRL